MYVCGSAASGWYVHVKSSFEFIWTYTEDRSVSIYLYMGVGWLERVCERESSELSGMYDFETASYGYD